MQTKADKSISSEEMQMLQSAHQQFVDIRSDFIKRVSESEDENVLELRDSTPLLRDNKAFDVVI
jgi:hypothetical protein